MVAMNPRFGADSDGGTPVSVGCHEDSVDSAKDNAVELLCCLKSLVAALSALEPDVAYRLDGAIRDEEGVGIMSKALCLLYECEGQANAMLDLARMAYQFEKGVRGEDKE